MKNAFKFGFLGLAIAVGTAACNSASNNSDEKTADSLDAVIEGTIELERDSLEVVDSLDSVGIDTLRLDTVAND